MLLPSALAPDGIPPSNLRTVGLLPFIYVFPALALSSLKSQTVAVGMSFTSLESLIFTIPDLRPHAQRLHGLAHHEV